MLFYLRLIISFRQLLSFPNQPGRRNPRYCFCNIYINIISIKIPKNFYWRVPLISQRFTAPLCHPSAVSALYLPSVTVLGQNRLSHIRSRQIIFKKLIYDSGNTVKNISSMNPFVIIGSGRCNCKIFSFVPVPFRIDSVQCK